MVTCGHQFSMGDECDWLINSSAVCPVNGSSSPAKILRQLMEAHCKTKLIRGEESRMILGYDDLNESKIENHQRNSDMSPCFDRETDQGDRNQGRNERTPPELPLDEGDFCEKGNKKKERIESVSVYSDPEDFEDAQHLDGCPMKWFHNRRARNASGSCAAPRRKQGQNNKINNPGDRKFRDRIPLEVKIGKINLNRRGSKCNFKNFHDIRKRECHNEGENFKTFEIDPKVIENQKKRLAAKLNWRPFQEGKDHGNSGSSNDGSSATGCYRPRINLWGKSPISILLFPYDRQVANLRSCANDKEGLGPKKDKIMSASLEIESSSFSEVLEPIKIQTSKTARSLAWGSINNCTLKKPQLPKQMNVSFYAPELQAGPSAAEGSFRGLKKQNERTRMKNRSGCLKGSHSLTSLSYDLEDKANGRKVTESEYLMDIMRKLSIENNLREMRNVIISPGLTAMKKKKETLTSPAKNRRFFERWPDDEHFKIICNKVKFSQRPQKGK